MAHSSMVACASDATPMLTQNAAQSAHAIIQARLNIDSDYTHSNCPEQETA